MSKTIVIDDLLDTLPFDTLGWERYQVFCADVLKMKLGVGDSREYLSQGAGQEGIDIYAVEKGSDKKVVAQCKRVNYLSPGDVTELVDEFLDGDFASETKEFIICTSYDLSKHLNEDAIESARQRLREKNIELLVWDEQGLSRQLRLNPSPEIIYHYFKGEVALAFYGDIWRDYISRLNKVPKKIYSFTEDYIERTIVAYIEQQPHSSFFLRGKTDYLLNISLIDLFNSKPLTGGRKIVLLSEAGFGKTEELIRLAAFYSDEHKPVHPVRYFLKDYEGQPVEILLSNHSDQWQNIPKQNLLLLFDGLDEINEQHATTFINNLNAFVENNPGCNVLVTSRYNAYDLMQQPLREFDVYLPLPINNGNIENYIEKKLPGQSVAFRQQVETNNFTDYLRHPYYLTRLVRYFDDPTIAFPHNKSQLFERVLFEQLDKDAARYNIAELKEQLLPIAKKIAFCMTLTGKSKISKDELKTIVPANEERRLLRNFCILIFNAEQSSWSFEHKNLQEYLCGSLLSAYSFIQIKDFISFSFDRNRLLPRFLNTLSFLFEIAGKETTLFKELLAWIQANQPQILVRFEKEQLDKTIRQDIFKNIVAYYINRKIPLRLSSNFHVEELAEFAAIDKPLVDYIGSVLKDCYNDIAYDLISILGYAPRKFIYAAQLTEILLAVLKDNQFKSYVRGEAAYELCHIDLSDKKLFELALTVPGSHSEFEIRRKLISAIGKTNYYDGYSLFITGSIAVYETGQEKGSIGGVNESLERLLVKLDTAAGVKTVLQQAILHKSLIPSRQHYTGVELTIEQIKTLLEKAARFYKDDSRMLQLVYRIFISNPSFLHYEPFVIVFKYFFAATCGTSIIFEKLYDYGFDSRFLFSFADTTSVDWLIGQYKKGNIPDSKVITIRNRLSWVYRPLCDYYLAEMNALTGNKFIIEEDPLDYVALSKLYEEKNQQFLVDQPLFLSEAAAIFDALDKTSVEYMDLYDSGNAALNALQYSSVKDVIARFSVHHAKTKEEFTNYYSVKKYWDDYRIQGIKELLQQGTKINLLPAVQEVVLVWLQEKIEGTDFSKAVRNDNEGRTFLNEDILLIKEIFMLTGNAVTLPDTSLLKMLPADYSGMYNSENDEGLALRVAGRITDNFLLKQTVMLNIRSCKLAAWVLATHFKLCHALKYNECLPDLYMAITSNSFFNGNDKRILTGYYLELGGEICDFLSFLKKPVITKPEHNYTAWEWYLLEKFSADEPLRVGEILVEVLNDPQQTDDGRVNAMQLLMQLGRPEGMDYCIHFIKARNELPTEHHIQSFLLYMQKASTEKTIAQLLETLDYCLEHKINGGSFHYTIPEFIYHMLQELSLSGRDSYEAIKKGLDGLESKYASEEFAVSLRIFSEQLSHQFFEKHEYVISVAGAVAYYKNLVVA